METGLFKQNLFILLALFSSCAKSQNDCNIEVKMFQSEAKSDTEIIESIFFVSNFDYSNICYSELLDLNNTILAESNNGKENHYTYLNYNSEMRNLLESDDYFDITSSEFNDYILMKCRVSKIDNYKSIVLWRYGEIIKIIE